MEKRVLGVFAFLLVGFLAACTSQPNPLSSGPTALDSADQPYSNVEEYKIGVADQLNVIVWRNAELSISVPVRPDGKISVPLVGDIHAAGLTSENLAKEINAKLEAFIRTPQVTVIITNAASAEYLTRVRVIGAVGRPLSVPFRKGMTVLDVVLLAGGVTPFASANKAKLYRITEEGTEIYGINLGDMLKKGDVKRNYPLRPLDIITVPERLF